jgi:hypothetical protein
MAQHMHDARCGIHRGERLAHPFEAIGDGNQDVVSPRAYSAMISSSNPLVRNARKNPPGNAREEAA